MFKKYYLPDLIEVLRVSPHSEYSTLSADGVSYKSRIGPFWLSKYPVTNGDYLAYVRSVGWATRPVTWQGEEPKDNSLRLPLQGIAATEAEAYCRWLSATTQCTVRLPQEVEWEYAAGGPDGLRYPWGENFAPDLCNSLESGVDQVVPVDSYPGGASVFGFMDMVGNANEYCADVFRGLDSPDASGGRDSDGALARVLRGGGILRLQKGTWDPL